MTPEIRSVLQRSVSLAFSDISWQFYGYQKRPVHGSIANRIRPSWRVALERSIFAEIIITNVAAHVAGGQMGIEAVSELADFFTHDPKVGACIGHTSSRGLQEAILEYANAPTDEWSGILASRLDIDRVADKQLAAHLLVACAQFPRVASLMIAQVQQNFRS